MQYDIAAPGFQKVEFIILFATMSARSSFHLPNTIIIFVHLIIHTYIGTCIWLVIIIRINTIQMYQMLSRMSE